MIITPDFIPHKNFHLGSWLIEKDNPSWYYFHPKRDLKNFNYSKNFYETLDKPLREVVKFLHQNNVDTTPSCAGHFYPKEIFRETYGSLKGNEKNIRGKGLILQNPETGEFFKYRNSDYVLPWDEETFVDRAMGHQTKGCLGLKPQDNKLSKHLTSKPISGFKTYFDRDNNIVIFVTDSNSVEEKNDKWNNFTNQIMKLL